MRAAKVTIFSVLVFAGLFSLISVLFYFGDWTRLAWVASFGAFVGVVAAPELDRKAFKYPSMLQTICGGVAGYILALVLELSPGSSAALTCLGLMLGATTTIWVKYVQIP